MAWLGIVAFSFQIYFDFSGYSDMAIGLGRMFGFKFPVNFNYPYISKSITEFWRRWHITLGTWFREYVYIPLGGNRCSKAKNIRNIVIVWVLTGIWHGAAYNFIIWGLYFGVILIIEKMTGLGKVLEKIPALFSHIYALVLILIGWVIFELNSLSGLGSYLGAMFGLNGAGAGDGAFLFTLKEYAAILVILILASTPIPKKIANEIVEKVSSQNLQWIWFIMENGFNIMVLLVSTAYLLDVFYDRFFFFYFF